jgi:hypothetical protein
MVFLLRCNGKNWKSGIPEMDRDLLAKFREAQGWGFRIF